jgi:hypothetical protein
MLKNSDFCELVQRPVPHHIILNGSLDPPYRVGAEAHPAIGVELARGLHKADTRFLNQVVHRRAVTAILRCHRNREAHVGRHEPVERGLVRMVAPSPRQREFRLRIKQFGRHRLGGDRAGSARHAVVHANSVIPVALMPFGVF